MVDYLLSFFSSSRLLPLGSTIPIATLAFVRTADTNQTGLGVINRGYRGR